MHSRQKANSKPAENPPKDHDFETSRERLKQTSDGKDESASEQSLAAAKDVAYATRDEGCDCERGVGTDGRQYASWPLQERSVVGSLNAPISRMAT